MPLPLPLPLALDCRGFPIAFAPLLPPIMDARPTLLSATEQGEMPSIALAASRRSSRVAVEAVLLLLRLLMVSEVDAGALFIE